MTPDPVEIDAAAEIGVRNSQPEGIGRVVVLGELICWNNLGRNVIFADGRCRPHAVFGQTRFPGEDEPSQYDLDIHAILDLPESGLVLVLNHFGAPPAFRRSELLDPGPFREVEPQATTAFAADVERTVLAGTCLVGSRPRNEGAVGVLVSAPLDAAALDAPIETDLAAQNFGQVTALGIVSGADKPLLALGGEGHVALAPLIRGKVAGAKWQVEVGFRAAVMVWDGRLLWTAGCAITPSADDYDWESLRGGGFAGLDPKDGRIVLSGTLPDDVAWGTGGVAVVALRTGLAAVGRTGRLYVMDPAHPTGWRSTAPLTSTSLGLAHADALEDGVLVGFNRGGYRLHRFG